MREECFFSFFQADGVDDGFPLQTFQAGGDNLPFGRVYHYRNTGYFRLGSHQIEESGHFLFRIQQTVVHIYVDNLRSVFYLLTGDTQCFGIVLFVNEPQEFARACHVAAFAYVDEIGFGADNEIFEPADVQTVVFRDGTAGRGVLCDFPIAGYVLGCRSATTTHDIYQSLVDKFFYLCSHRCGRFVIFAQPIGQSGIGVSTDVIGGDRCQPM